jgi:hypothetical protein
MTTPALDHPTPAPRLQRVTPSRGRCEWPGKAGSTASWAQTSRSGGG